MANIKSAQKRMRQTAVRQARNKSVRSRLRTAVKKHRATEGAPKPESLATAYSEIELPFASLPTREQLDKDVASKDRSSTSKSMRYFHVILQCFSCCRNRQSIDLRRRYPPIAARTRPQ